jgi:hypothetical protein
VIRLGLVALALVAAGAPTTAAGSAGTSPTRIAYSACDTFRPIRLSIEPPEFETWVDACTSRSYRKLALENQTNLVLRIDLPRQTVRAFVEDPLASSFATKARLTAVPGTCVLGLWCTVPAGSTVYTVGSSAMSLSFSVDASGSASANAARYVGSWVDRQVGAPNRFLRGAVSCASDVASLHARLPTWEDALRFALVARESCSSVYDAVRRESSTVSRSGVAETVGKAIAGGSWIDELSLGLAKLIRAIR